MFWIYAGVILGILTFLVLSVVDWARKGILASLPKLTMFVFLMVSLIAFAFEWWAGVAGLIFSFLFFLFNLTKVEADPPHRAILLILGRRVPVVISEGWHLALKPFSLYSFLPIKVQKINSDFEFDEIRTRARKDDENGDEEPRAGGKLSVQVSITYEPDYTSGERLIEYLNAGQEPGVDTIVNDLIEEDLRQAGSEHDWESYNFAKEDFSMDLLEKLTGEKPSPETLNQMRREGLPDVVDLGIKIFRFTIGKIVELGALKDAADQYEKERQERRGEEVEMQFVLQRVRELISEGLSPEEAIEAVQAQQGKIEKKVSSFRGLEKIAESLGVTLTDLLLTWRGG